LFTDELAARRAEAGLSQAELAQRLNYSESLVAMVESRRRAPTLEFAERCDTVFGFPGTFARLQQHARKTPLPGWFRPYAEIEAAATQLRSWQPAFVDGLLQTEDYARALLSARPNTPEDEVEALVSARMERQNILRGDDPPLLWFVIDEGALHRRIGSEKIMRDQMFALAELSLRPNINVQVVPYSAGGHYALLGAFAIVETEDGARVGYLETALDGYIVESPPVVAQLMVAFDTVRSETLSRSASKDFIRQCTEDSWT
jgi:transcriptional regulator with XRE-family HTH domain